MKEEKKRLFLRKLSSLEPILFVYFWSFQPSPTTVKRMALISLTPCIYQVSHVLYTRHEMSVGMHIAGREYFTLHSDLKTAVRLPPQRNTDTLKDTCSKYLWNRNTASKNTVRMRDYYPAVPSIYVTRNVITVRHNRLTTTPTALLPRTP